VSESSDEEMEIFRPKHKRTPRSVPVLNVHHGNGHDKDDSDDNDDNNDNDDELLVSVADRQPSQARRRAERRPREENGEDDAEARGLGRRRPDPSANGSPSSDRGQAMVDLDDDLHSEAGEPMLFSLFQPKPRQLVQSTLSLVSRSARRPAAATDTVVVPPTRHYAVEMAVTETNDLVQVVCLERYMSVAALQAQVGSSPPNQAREQGVDSCSSLSKRTVRRLGSSPASNDSSSRYHSALSALIT